MVPTTRGLVVGGGLEFAEDLGIDLFPKYRAELRAATRVEGP